jgi:hypothetical protein
VADAVSAGLLAAVAEGPRATEQFAAVAAVFVGGLTAGARAQDISARFLEMLVARLQQVGGQRYNKVTKSVKVQCQFPCSSSCVLLCRLWNIAAAESLQL